MPISESSLLFIAKNVPPTLIWYKKKLSELPQKLYTKIIGMPNLFIILVLSVFLSASFGADLSKEWIGTWEVKNFPVSSYETKHIRIAFHKDNTERTTFRFLERFEREDRIRVKYFNTEENIWRFEQNFSYAPRYESGKSSIVDVTNNNRNDIVRIRVRMGPEGESETEVYYFFRQNEKELTLLNNQEEANLSLEELLKNLQRVESKRLKLKFVGDF